MSNAFAETYRANFTAKTSTGKDKGYSIEITYQVNSDGTIEGKYNPFQAGACGGERAISGLIQNEMLDFVTNVHGLKGCGVNRFKGKKQDDAWVGKINFSGEQRDIIFQKVKK
jgi:hypothetical protein